MDIFDCVTKMRIYEAEEIDIYRLYSFLGLSHLIFFGVPPPLQPVERGGSVKGEKRNS